MDLKALLLPGLVIGLLGGVFALVLAFVAKKFAVHHDPELDEVAAVLPGLNCGGCGFPSCFAYAESVYKHPHVPLTFCKPGGDEVAEGLAQVLGRALTKSEKTVAKLLCRGGREHAADEFIYSGIYLCRAAHLVKGGPKLCKQGCLGFGDCVSACKFNAMDMGESGLPFIDRNKCVACGACVKACPLGLIQLIPESARVFVECRNIEKTAVTKQACEVGCIGCRLCEKECPFDAIHVINNVAAVDYAKCKMCGKCVKVCPRNIILELPHLPPKTAKGA